MTWILLIFCFIIELSILYILIKKGIIELADIKTIIRPLNIIISLITIISNRLLKQNELRVKNDIQLIKGFMEFFEIAHARQSSWKVTWRSEQVAAMFAVAELGKRHGILKNIAQNWLKDITERRTENTDADWIKTTEEIKCAAKRALEMIN